MEYVKYVFIKVPDLKENLCGVNIIFITLYVTQTQRLHHP